MSTSFFEKQGTAFSRRNVILGMGAIAGVSMFPGMANAMPGRIRRSFVAVQVQHALRIITEERFVDVLSNRYLVSALYYSERFLARVAQPVHQTDVPSMIIGRIQSALTASVRQEAHNFFVRAVARESTISHTERLPLRRFSFGHGQNHVDAVDLFAQEGSGIYAYADGLVLLADNGWRDGDQYSSASLRGGNTVITFNPVRREFYRYAHLRAVEVAVGQVVTAGQRLGTVGNTGINAVRPGHGGHLHFEINEHHIASRTNAVVPATEIRERLQALL